MENYDYAKRPVQGATGRSTGIWEWVGNGTAILAPILVTGLIVLILSSCATVAPANVEAALEDIERAAEHAAAGIAVLENDPELAEAARDFVLAYGDVLNARHDLLGEDHPDKSCIDRCTSCQGTSQCEACPLFSCMSNCSAGHHPVCLYGCTPGGSCPYGDDCPDNEGDRDYSALAKMLDDAAHGDPEALKLMESCGSRCDDCKHCHGDPAHGVPNECPANRCCDPIDCWDNCAEKQHPVCCAGC